MQATPHTFWRHPCPTACCNSTPMTPPARWPTCPRPAFRPMPPTSWCWATAAWPACGLAARWKAARTSRSSCRAWRPGPSNGPSPCSSRTTLSGLSKTRCSSPPPMARCGCCTRPSSRVTRTPPWCACAALPTMGTPGLIPRPWPTPPQAPLCASPSMCTTTAAGCCPCFTAALKPASPGTAATTTAACCAPPTRAAPGSASACPAAWAVCT